MSEEIKTEVSLDSPPPDTMPVKGTPVTLLESLCDIYEKLEPPLEKGLYQLPKKGLLRVMLALIKVPCEDFTKKLNAQERQLYALADRVLMAKMSLEQLVMLESANEPVKGDKNG